MSFFNKKEEVIDLQLTQYGKQLLSKGIFKPIYYSFFDSNVIYDSSYSGITNEVITSIEQRIQQGQTTDAQNQNYLASKLQELRQELTKKKDT